MKCTFIIIKIIYAPLLLLFLLAYPTISFANKDTLQKPRSKKTTILYGQASFYAAKFQGRYTANGEKFNHAIYTGACNTLPLGTRVKVTNLNNGKTIVVKINDRLHPKTSRLIDLTKTAAEKLGFVKAGLTRVKVEVLAKNADF